jgi:hypothetical protein
MDDSRNGDDVNPQRMSKPLRKGEADAAQSIGGAVIFD